MKLKDSPLYDKDWLYQKRVVEKLSYKKIGKILDVADITVSRVCKRFGFPSENYSNVPADVDRYLKDKDWLYQKRVVEKLSYKKIGDMIGTSMSSVMHACEEFQINLHIYKSKQDDIKSLLENKDWLYQKRVVEQMTLSEMAKSLGIDRSTITTACRNAGLDNINHKRISSVARESLDNYDWLWQKYKTECLTHRQIGKELGVSEEPVRDALVKFNIEANSRDLYANGSSVAEKEIIEFIKTFYSGEIITSNKVLLNGREVDIYIPEKKLAIEYNGVYFHLFRPEETIYSLKKDSTYHVSKTDNPKEQGIELIQIWSGDWESKKDIWKSRIKSKFGVITNKIYARKCIIKEISSKDKNEFLNKNHLQGGDRSSTKLGLYYNEDLVSVMTFIKADSYKSAEWELSRFATKNDTIVVGGFSKLLGYFRKNTIGSIVSYADRMHSTGDVYLKNGFTLHHINKPSYHYVKRGSDVLENRQKFMKYKIKRDESDTRTEFEIASELGYSRIFDCGTITFVLQ